MHSLRSAALAVATAAAVALSGTAVAGAEEDNPAKNDIVTTSSSNWDNFFDSYGHQNDNDVDDREAVGTDMLGKEKHWGQVNDPAKTWYAVTIAGIVGTALGAILGGVNWLKNQGIIPA